MRPSPGAGPGDGPSSRVHFAVVFAFKSRALSRSLSLVRERETRPQVVDQYQPAQSPPIQYHLHHFRMQLLHAGPPCQPDLLPHGERLALGPAEGETTFHDEIDPLIPGESDPLSAVDLSRHEWPGVSGSPSNDLARAAQHRSGRD